MDFMNTRCFVFVLLFLLGMPALPCHAQSLADAARQERARRPNQKSSSKVFTNEDLGRYQETESPSSPSTVEAVQPPEPPTTGSRSEGVGSSDADERAWSKR